MKNEKPILIPRPEGLYCEAGGFFIDPSRAVDKALITHGHADHARAGHQHVLATRQTLDIMAIRYGDSFCVSEQVAALGENIQINNALVSFHPAGHVLGSAQIRVEANGQIVVVSGDYKRRPGPTCAAFEPIACGVFVTEATFGLPVFQHPNTMTEIAKVTDALQKNPDRCVIIGAYSLGKAQRIIRELRDNGHGHVIYIHGALQPLCAYYEQQGIKLGKLEPATLANGEKGAFTGSVVIGPPSAIIDRWGRRFPNPIVSFASGWMRVRQRAKQSGVELPLIISDHADWDELTSTINEISPQEVWVTHGREEALVRWCHLNQISAKPLHLVGFDDEAE